MIHWEHRQESKRVVIFRVCERQRLDFVGMLAVRELRSQEFLARKEEPMFLSASLTVLDVENDS